MTCSIAAILRYGSVRPACCSHAITCSANVTRAVSAGAGPGSAMCARTPGHRVTSNEPRSVISRGGDVASPRSTAHSGGVGSRSESPSVACEWSRPATSCSSSASH